MVVVIEADEAVIRENLPSYIDVNKLPNTSYNNIAPEIFSTSINQIYEEMVKWKRNLFMLPTGKTGKAYIKLTSEWLNHFNNDSTFQGMSLRVVMVLPNLLLQKPSSTSKAKEHTKTLESRLKLWSEGKFVELLRECKTIQRKLKAGKKKTVNDINRIFSKLIFEGKISAALKFLDENSENGVLESNQEVVNKLKDLHPTPTEIQPGTLLRGPILDIPLRYFTITEEDVQKAANRVNGSGGPSQMDAKQWRRILSSKHFKAEGKELREEIAIFAKKIATEILDPVILEDYTACRLIPLNKAPGEPEMQIRPIGVGEVLRRIVGKTLVWALNDDIQEAGGPLQVSTGLKGGAEAAIHAMKDIFLKESTDAVILVDAENAFNKLNRKVALHNIRYLCPAFATILINTYRTPSRLFITGGGEIFSSEGTTQGDSLAMAFYGISVNPLLTRLEFNQTNVHQVWLADDATGAGTLQNLKLWWDKIIVEGGKFGYYVKPSKSWLVIKDPTKLAEAEILFADCPIRITSSGKRHLGAAIGSPDYKVTYMEEKVKEWCNKMRKLSEIAKSQPHAAYSAYIFGEQHRYNYFLRTLDNIEDVLQPLDDILTNEFIPSLFGSNISPNEREIFSLPIKEGGLGLRIPSKNAAQSYIASRKITAPLTEKIKSQDAYLPTKEEVKTSRAEAMSTMKVVAGNQTKEFIANQTIQMARNLEQLSEPGASSWLGAIPLKEQGFNLNKSEFQDALNLRYDRPLKNLPSKCPCGMNFDVTHVMNCHRGGFINARHDNVRNFEGRLLKDVCNDVQIEPILQPVNGVQFHRSANTNDEARLDVRAKGFWRQGQNAFFDIRVTNADNASQKNKTIKAVLKTHEAEKKRQYNARVMEIEHGTFTPIVLTIKGVMGQECQIFHKTLAERLSNKTGEKYEDIMRLIRIKISFIALKSTLLCLHGSRALNNFAIERCDDFTYRLNEL